MITTHADASRVRVATACDEPELLELCRRNHVETGLGAFSPEKVRAVFRRAFDAGRNDPAVIGVVGDACIEGSIGLILEEPWASETAILTARWNYVLPEFRASTNLRDLTAFARRFALPRPAGWGVPVVVEAIATRKTEALVKMYRRQLGEPVAVTWLCEATEVH